MSCLCSSGPADVFRSPLNGPVGQAPERCLPCRSRGSKDSAVAGAGRAQQQESVQTPTSTLMRSNAKPTQISPSDLAPVRQYLTPSAVVTATCMKICILWGAARCFCSQELLECATGARRGRGIVTRFLLLKPFLQDNCAASLLTFLCIGMISLSHIRARTC